MAMHAHSAPQSQATMRIPLRDLQDATTFPPHARSADCLTIDQVTPLVENLVASEKALAFQAASISCKVKEWLALLESWKWSGTFEGGGEEEDSRLSKGKSTGAEALSDRETEITVIQEQLESLNVDELKGHVRLAHNLGQDATTVNDFKTVLTTVVMEMLPTLVRLNQKISMWKTRHEIMRMAPSYQQSISKARNAVDAAWNTIQLEVAEQMTRSAYQTMRSVLQSAVEEAGVILDSMLDNLEGHGDSLPDPWIDMMEALQRDYEEWIMNASRIVEDNELREANQTMNGQSMSLSNTKHDGHHHLEQKYGSAGRPITPPYSRSGASTLIAVETPESSSLGLSAYPTEVTEGEPIMLTSPTRKMEKSLDEQISEKIESLLLDMPIKLAPTAPVKAKTKKVLKGSESPVSTPASPITLAPAPQSSKSHGQGDSSIRVYHLTQPGKEGAPLKLFVRLVGENGERVMVRVGGGWADLGEYLREYASHHGRSVSLDNTLEIQGIPSAQIPGSAMCSSGRATPTSRPDTPTGRPSVLGIKKTRRTSGATTSPSLTPDMPTRYYDATTPDSVASARSVSSSTWFDKDGSLGLAGPRGKRADVSPNKQAWVNGMMQQARSVSSGKMRTVSGDETTEMVEGGIRRVFMRKIKP